MEDVATQPEADQRPVQQDAAQQHVAGAVHQQDGVQGGDPVPVGALQQDSPDEVADGGGSDGEEKPAKRCKKEAAKSTNNAQRSAAMKKINNSIRLLIVAARLQHDLQCFFFIGNPAASLDDGDNLSRVVMTERLAPVVADLAVETGLISTMLASTTSLIAQRRFPQSTLCSSSLPHGLCMDVLKAVLHAASISVAVSRSSAMFSSKFDWFPTDIQYTDMAVVRGPHLIRLITLICSNFPARQAAFLAAVLFLRYATIHQYMAIEEMIKNACNPGAVSVLLLR